MTRLGYWLAGLGGGRRDILDDVPGSPAKYKALGGVLLATAAMASVSAAYAVHLGLGLPAGLALAAGLGWGIIILTLDRALIQTMSNQRGFWRNLSLAVPRLLIALVLGYVVSTPLVLRIFDKEIANQIVITEIEKADAHAKADTTDSDYAQIPVLQQRIKCCSSG